MQENGKIHKKMVKSTILFKLQKIPVQHNGDFRGSLLKQETPAASW